MKSQNCYLRPIFFFLCNFEKKITFLKMNKGYPFCLCFFLIKWKLSTK